MDKNACIVQTDEDVQTIDYLYALESACGDLQFLVSCTSFMQNQFLLTQYEPRLCRMRWSNRFSHISIHN